MRKLLFSICALILMTIPIRAEWLELYIPLCGNQIYAGKADFYDTVQSSVGLINVHETFMDLEANTTTFIRGVVVTTVTIKLNGGTTTWADESAFTMPRCPRNIGVGIKLGAQEGLDGDCDVSTNSVIGYCTVTGIDSRGIERTEVIYTSSSYKMNYSSYAYCKMTSAIWTFTKFINKDWGTYSDLASIELHMGIGPKIGLANDIRDAGKNGSIYKVQENGTNIKLNLSTLEISPTYDTYDPVTNPTATADYDIWYKAIQR